MDREKRETEAGMLGSEGKEESSEGESEVVRGKERKSRDRIGV